MKKNNLDLKVELCNIIRELDRIRAYALKTAMEDGLDDAEKFKVMSLLESYEPMVNAIQAIRVKLDNLEDRIVGERH